MIIPAIIIVEDSGLNTTFRFDNLQDLLIEVAMGKFCAAKSGAASEVLNEPFCLVTIVVILDIPVVPVHLACNELTNMPVIA